jgi:hypothetical protein
MLAVLDDLDDDGIAELAIAAPGAAGGSSPGTSEVVIVSGATGVRLRLLSALEPGELYGRMLAVLDDLDGDGARDLAIGAPWFGDRAGRVEVRSARGNGILAELVGERPGFAVSSLRHRDGRGAVEVHELR